MCFTWLMISTVLYCVDKPLKAIRPVLTVLRRIYCAHTNTMSVSPLQLSHTVSGQTGAEFLETEIGSRWNWINHHNANNIHEPTHNRTLHLISIRPDRDYSLNVRLAEDKKPGGGAHAGYLPQVYTATAEYIQYRWDELQVTLYTLWPFIKPRPAWPASLPPLH